MIPDSPSAADHSRHFSPLTYRDPTGETAVRNLMGRSAQLTWDNGFILHIRAEDLNPLLAQLDFQMSRKGHIWGHKKKAPETSGNSFGSD